MVDRRVLAGGFLLCWAGFLINDVHKLKTSEAFRNSPTGQQSSQVRVFGVDVK